MHEIVWLRIQVGVDVLWGSEARACGAAGACNCPYREGRRLPQGVRTTAVLNSAVSLVAPDGTLVVKVAIKGNFPFNS